MVSHSLEGLGCFQGRWGSAGDGDTLRPLGSKVSGAFRGPCAAVGRKTSETPSRQRLSQAKAADSACLLPTSPAWPCRQRVRSESGPAHSGVRHHRSRWCWSWLRACGSPFVGCSGSSLTCEMGECDSINGKCQHHLVFAETVPAPLRSSQSRRQNSSK